MPSRRRRSNRSKKIQRDINDRKPTQLLCNPSMKRNNVNKKKSDEVLKDVEKSELALQTHEAEVEEHKHHELLNALQHASNMAMLNREKSKYLAKKVNLLVNKAGIIFRMAEIMKAYTQT